MDYGFLGETGIRVSRVGLGCWSLVGDLTWGAQEETDSLAAIGAARDCGINFFDTAPGYGNGSSESLLGKALRGWRDEAVLATKVSGRDLSAADLVRSCEESLGRLQTDRIDLYQIHWPNPKIPLAETVEALEWLREQGKIRSYGVCNFGRRDMADFLARGRFVSNQLVYSLLARPIEYEIQPRCVEEGMGILCYSPLAQGLLTGKFRCADEVPEGRARTRHFSSERPHVRHGEAGCEAETFEAIGKIGAICEDLGESMEHVALAWLLHRSGVTSVLAGGRRADQVRSNAAAAGLKLDAAVVDELARVTEGVKLHLGADPDLWTSAAATRIR